VVSHVTVKALVGCVILVLAGDTMHAQTNDLKQLKKELDTLRIQVQKLQAEVDRLKGGAYDQHEDGKPRNPFGVKDIEDPDDDAVQDLAARVMLTGDDGDANAEQWVQEATAGKKGSLEGKWFDRWGNPLLNYGTGTEVKVVGNRVYMLVNASNGKFLIDLKRDKNRLLGKYQGIDNPSDTGPCVFLVVDDERIDGVWGPSGTARWDFRRKLKK
jgi:hypothetical protein